MQLKIVINCCKV